LDAQALRSAAGPQRILRENVPLVDRSFAAETIDGRWAAWDPPEKSLAMLCNYVPLQTSPRWQVLGKVANRCGRPQLIASLHTHFGVRIAVPAPPAGAVVYAEINGAGVSGLENIRALIYRPARRYVVVNGSRTYRLVPSTAGD